MDVGSTLQPLLLLCNEPRVAPPWSPSLYRVEGPGARGALTSKEGVRMGVRYASGHGPTTGDRGGRCGPEEWMTAWYTHM